MPEYFLKVVLENVLSHPNFFAGFLGRALAVSGLKNVMGMAKLARAACYASQRCFSNTAQDVEGGKPAILVVLPRVDPLLADQLGELGERFIVVAPAFEHSGDNRRNLPSLE